MSFLFCCGISKNTGFVNYDGITFPFEDDSFDIVITRYALHHFPTIKDTFSEIHRVLKKGGVFFLSDPAPNDDDTEHFVDEYMQMKKDGHIKFYTQDEWNEIAGVSGLKFLNGFLPVFGLLFLEFFPLIPPAH